ncbi:MAG: glycosyltransferase family 2 protein, partial [bacterium]|nr:glycosyltransferase family 2 protein [bacterium]
MKKLGYIILFYGKPYLQAAVAAIYPQVDRIVVLYTDKPSQGFITDTPCPDTEEELKACVAPYKDKILWIKGEWHNQGEHTNAVFDYAAGYDYLVRFDADEIYPEGMVDAMIEQAEASDAHHFQLPFQHFWRSFDRVCRDSQRPYRLVKMKGGEGDQILDSLDWKWAVYHMGYAQPDEYVRFKLKILDHAPEYRPDWLDMIWDNSERTEDLHPVSLKMWNSEHFD